MGHVDLRSVSTWGWVAEERGRIKYEQQESGKGKIDLKPRIAVSYFIFKGDELLVFYLFTYIRPSEKGCGAL